MGFRNKNVPVLNQRYYSKQEMQNLQQKRKRKLLIRRLSVFFVFVGVVVYLTVKTLYSQENMLMMKEQQLKELQDQYKNIADNQIRLQEEIIKLQDDEYIGKYVRQELFLSDDGEIIFSIPIEEEEQDSD